MKPARLVPLLLLVACGALSIWAIVLGGPLGFLGLARREPWGLQMFVDLGVYCGLAILWLITDARRHRIAAWPYVVATIAAGSLGVLAYLVHRAGRAAPDDRLR